HSLPIALHPPLLPPTSPSRSPDSPASPVSPSPCAPSAPPPRRHRSLPPCPQRPLRAHQIHRSPHASRLREREAHIHRGASTFLFPVPNVPFALTEPRRLACRCHPVSVKGTLGEPSGEKALQQGSE